MSYCRWSTDNYRCDLYCYGDASGGYTTHVARRRRVHVTPPPPSEMDYAKECHDRGEQVNGVKFIYARTLYRQWYESIPWEDTSEIHSGETFSDNTLEEFKSRLLDLRAKGYLFPDHVIETVDEEIAEQNS